MKLRGVNYLEGGDISKEGKLLPHVVKGKKLAIVMVQGNFCGYCNKAKPDYEKLAELLPSVAVLTVQIDGAQGDKEASKNISVVNKNPGVPSYLIFDRNGNFLKSHDGGRDVQSLANSLKSLL
jgi:thiol-disulfide isomerase/thioredoxin